MVFEHKSRLSARRLCSARIGDATLLDAVARDVEGGESEVTLFFATGTDSGRVSLASDGVVVATGNLSGAPWLTVRVPPGERLRIACGDSAADVSSARDEAAVFEGANAFLATRNGESAETVLAWLDFHATCHGVTGAVIIDRARPGSDPTFETLLAEGLDRAEHDCAVVVLSCDHPLGRSDLPAEAHPFCVAEAPGKDRMEVPPPDPWSSPLGQPLVHEIAKARFLSEARAVANIDVCDLLAPAPDVNVFDRAVAAQGGVIALLGRHCYPWRIRENQPIRFGDHICVQFDHKILRRRWCLAPAKAPSDATWRLVRMGNAPVDDADSGTFYRCMSLRHPERSVSRIVPKSSLIEHPPLIELSKRHFAHNPVRMPEVRPDTLPGHRERRVIVTTMKNEGPFILEWIAYHRAVGFDDFLVYTNDCSDGTDRMLDLLQTRGIVQHRDNPYCQSGLKPQHAALQAADGEAVVKDATWVVCMDVDEYVNVRTGAGTLDDLFATVPDANMISMTWRLFGNSDVHEFQDRFVTEQFTRCAPEFVRKPHQAWGFKTLYKNIGLYKKLGVHRPKGLNPQLWQHINWVNGSGKPLPREMYRNAWRSTTETYGYDLVSLNHYAVRSAESFLVKRDRGRVNHVDRDQGLAYWFRMNHNVEDDLSIQRVLPAAKAEFDRLIADEEIAAMHAHCVKMHRAKIEELRATTTYSSFYADLTGPRLEKLSRLLPHFGSNVFLAGPEAIPDTVLERDPDEDFFFTVEQRKTAH
ncbi:glycosyltransferase family 2 protein [Defluviimonas sp. SAOS-178_SWC]|uniref:glycosyltransferase family 2 protein n=1 Tax=Defluviimonas sp. SAOS-178_SWC TaxID=3121287 RepID=UPI003221585A